jgi:hypothetical protein
VKRLVDGWLADDSLVRREERDPRTRRVHVCVGVGTPSLPAEPNDGPARG